MSKNELVMVQVKFPRELLLNIDALSKMKGDRSEFIRAACEEKLDREAKASEVPAR